MANDRFNISPRRDQPTATIADGQTVSGAVELGGMMLIGFVTDAGLNSTTMTFQASADGVTYAAVNLQFGALSYTVAASKYIKVNPTDFLGIRYLKFVGGTAETGATVITLDLSE